MGNTRMNDILMDILNGAQSGDPQAMLIAGLSAALLCILLLMLVIALIGRKETKTPAELPATASHIQMETDLDMPVSASMAAGDSLAVDESDAPAQTDDFMIFKRGERQNTQRKKEIFPSAEGLTIEDNLQLIEREMIKLRDLFKQGHVTRDVYVDETRNLYHQAKAIAALK
jgi:hypothetical protein